MAKLVLVLFALCVVPSIVATLPKPLVAPFVVTGRVYLDTCNAGFETTASRPLADASVEIRCTDRHNTSVVTYSNVTKTDSKGNYVVEVYYDQGQNSCHSLLLEHSECAKTSTDRSDWSLVILTSNNGLANPHRLANPVSCPTSTPLSNCAQVMEQYVDNEADD